MPEVYRPRLGIYKNLNAPVHQGGDWRDGVNADIGPVFDADPFHSGYHSFVGECWI